MCESRCEDGVEGDRGGRGGSDEAADSGRNRGSWKKRRLLEDADSRSQRAESFPRTTQARQWAGADEITRGK